MHLFLTDALLGVDAALALLAALLAGVAMRRAGDGRLALPLLAGSALFLASATSIFLVPAGGSLAALLGACYLVLLVILHLTWATAWGRRGAGGKAGAGAGKRDVKEAPGEKASDDGGEGEG